MKALKPTKIAAVVLLTSATLTACNSADEESSLQNSTNKVQGNIKTSQPELIKGFESRLNIYKEVTLTADLSHLSANQKKMLALLVNTSK